MTYEIEEKHQTIRRSVLSAFHIYVDMDADRVDGETLERVLAHLRTGLGVPVDIPSSPKKTAQMSLDDYLGQVAMAVDQELLDEQEDD